MTETPFLRAEEASSSPARSNSVSLVIYTPFGIVRGELPDLDRAQAVAILTRQQGIIEILNPVVEHSSNHLPTGKYSSLHLNLARIDGFAILGR